MNWDVISLNPNAQGLLRLYPTFCFLTTLPIVRQLLVALPGVTQAGGLRTISRLGPILGEGPGSVRGEQRFKQELHLLHLPEKFLQVAGLLRGFPALGRSKERRREGVG